MKAAVLREAGGPLILEEVPDPEPGPSDVLLRVRACGLGLTLVWNRIGRRGAGRLPRIIGHEIAGDVVKAGPLATGFQVGDRVNVYYYLTCGHCSWCVAGREDLCDNPSGRIGHDIDGGLAEYVSLPARNLCRIPPELGYDEAAVTADAIATPIHVLRARAKLQPGETVAVIGAGGGVGVHMVRTAVAFGARVIAVDITSEKLAVAREAGAAAVLDAGRIRPDKEVMRLTSGRGADVVVDMVGIDSTLGQDVAMLAKGGRLVLAGSYDDAATLPLQHGTVSGERAIMGSSYCTRSELALAVDLVARGVIRTSVTLRCGLYEADDVLRAIERKEVAGRACVVFDP